MRTLLAALACLVLFGCSNSSSGTGTPMLMLDATVAVNPNYCREECQNEQNIGTLMGTLQQCETQCCTNDPSECPPADAGATTTTSDAGTTMMTGGDDDDGSTSGDAAPAGTKCTSAEQCPGGQSISCCELQADGTGLCVPVDDAGDQTCLCKTPSDCPSAGLASDGNGDVYDLPGCCAPQTNSAGEPSGPYICKPNDAKNYDCCYSGSGNCASGFCCVVDPNMNQFCALPCTGDGGCGSAQCLSTYAFDFTLTTCKERGDNAACGP